MSTRDRLYISWDELASAWRISGDPAGPAGAAQVVLGTVVWHFDWIDPTRLVEALVPAQGDAPHGGLEQVALDAVERLCGPAVARELLERSGSTMAEVAMTGPHWLSGESIDARWSAGRLATALELASLTPSPTWWTVEAAWRTMTTAGAEGSGWADLADEAFDVVDSVPDRLLERLLAAGLVEPLRALLLSLDFAESELPRPLRLSDSEVREQFEELMATDGSWAALAGGPFPTPVFRSATGQGWRPGPEERDVDWIEVPVGVVNRSVWRRPDDRTVQVVVTVTGSAPPSLVARLVTLDGRAPRVVAVAPLRPTGTRDGYTTLSCRFSDDSDDELLRVELVERPDAPALPEPQRSRRHAANLARSAMDLERCADALTAVDGAGAVDAAARASRQWSAALAAWDRAGDPGSTAVCRRHLRRLLEVLDEADQWRSGETDRQADPQASLTIDLRGPASAPGWTESVMAVVRRYLADAAESAFDRQLPADDAAGLARLAESVNDIELAARFRSEQARAMPAGDHRDAVARLALRHFTWLGRRPPGDLESLGAAGG